ncbi:MAG: hypothetical protein CMM93_03135 [Rickettsiales bacterium]|nr:hypothetical protein [Rickettsiales bacterium]|tara:strand:- start:756 stop:1331 length:576 start_codon:yes stop_codon:yes gene_type:complete
MIIILEGVSCVGKSTVARLLMRRLKINLCLHFPTGNPSDLESRAYRKLGFTEKYGAKFRITKDQDYAKKDLDYNYNWIRNLEEDIILDRSYLSHKIYSNRQVKIKNKKSTFTLVARDTDTLKERFINRIGEKQCEFNLQSTIDAIPERNQDFIEENINLIYVDGKTPDEIANEIIIRVSEMKLSNYRIMNS